MSKLEKYATSDLHELIKDYELIKWRYEVLTNDFNGLGFVLIAEEIEEPFGHDMKDLSTDEMAQIIERNIKEIYNSKDA